MLSKPVSTLFPILLVLAWVLAAVPGANSQTQVAGVHFKWSLAALANPETDRQLISIDRFAELRSGDQLKFYLEPINPSYLYLFHVSPQGKLAVLFPTQGKYTDAPAMGGDFIPPGGAWFILDDVVGKEKFYLIAASRQLKELEFHLAQHLHLTNPEEIRHSTANVLAEIKKLRQKNRTLTVPAEKPVRLGGNFRGSETDSPKITAEIVKIARDVTAEYFYSRIITIDHR